MTRDELVAEVRDMVIWGMACHHQIGDPTILPAPKLKALLVKLRMAAFAGQRCQLPH